MNTIIRQFLGEDKVPRQALCIVLIREVLTPQTTVARYPGKQTPYRSLQTC